jgi:hypothetical protein
MAQPIVILACRVLETMLEPHIRARALPATFFEYGYHRTPKKLAPILQAQIDALAEPSIVVLGYGLCGNGIVGLDSRQHTLIVPHTDDCIAMLLGSRQRYLAEFNASPGTYYLTRGWLESGSNPLAAYEKLVPKYGVETADWLIDQEYRHYRRLVYIALDETDLATNREQVNRIVEFCATRWGMQFEARIGTNAFIERLMNEAIHRRESWDDFLVLPPGSVITQEMFVKFV